VTALHIFSPWWGALRVSSWFLILLWIGWDLLYLVLRVESNIAYIAHVVGFAIGFTIGFVLAWKKWIRPTRYEQTILQVVGMDR